MVMPPNFAGRLWRILLVQFAFWLTQFIPHIIIQLSPVLGKPFCYFSVNSDFQLYFFAQSSFYLCLFTHKL